MRMTTYLKSIITAGFAIFVLSGCSSGTTATGLGLGIGGSWTGTLWGPDGFIAQFSMQITQSAGEDPFAVQTLSGVMNTSKDCIGGGTFTGTLSGDSITLVVSANSTLNMSGTAKSNFMSGSWVLDQVTTETTTTTAATEEDAGSTTTSSSSSNACFSTGGNWEAKR